MHMALSHWRRYPYTGISRARAGPRSEDEVDATR